MYAGTMYKIAILVVTLMSVLAGCSNTSLTEEQQFQKEYDQTVRNHETVEGFHELRQECEASGGAIAVETRGRIIRNDKYTLWEMRTAKCAVSLWGTF